MADVEFKEQEYITPEGEPDSLNMTGWLVNAGIAKGGSNLLSKAK